jgi:hypothetical protein
MKCDSCGSKDLFINTGKGSRRCRPCHLRHLKTLLAIYSDPTWAKERAGVLAELRKIEEEGL